MNVQAPNDIPIESSSQLIFFSIERHFLCGSVTKTQASGLIIYNDGQKCRVTLPHWFFNCNIAWHMLSIKHATMNEDTHTQMKETLVLQDLTGSCFSVQLKMLHVLIYN